MSIVRKEDVLARLAAVPHPSGGDLVSAGAVKRVIPGEAKVTVILSLPGPAELNSEVKFDAREALVSLPGVTEINIYEELRPRPSAPAAEAADARRPEKAPIPGVRAVIAIAGAKGGIGRSTVATNVACALAASGRRVGLLDADIFSPAIPLFLGATAEPEVRADKKMVPVVAHGVGAMSLGLLVREAAPIVWRGAMVPQVLDQFLRDVAWGDLDLLLVDLPPGSGDAHAALFDAVPLDGAIVVTTPDRAALVDARRTVAILRKAGVAVVGIVENMTPGAGSEGARRVAEGLGIPFLGEVPWAREVRAACDSGHPLVLADAVAPAARALRAIAEEVARALAR